LHLNAAASVHLPKGNETEAGNNNTDTNLTEAMKKGEEEEEEKWADAAEEEDVAGAYKARIKVAHIQTNKK
jgi:hypothetical protein